MATSGGGHPPRWWPQRIYYGWALVGTLGITATVSYGILSYAFAVFIAPMSADLGWSRATVTGGFSLGALVAGLAGVPVGKWVDRHGARGVMTAGAVLACLLILAWSRVDSVPAYYALWAAMGVAMAAVLYEPAFAVVAVWFRRRRSRALTVLTFIGGFASVVFVPLAGALVEAHGWRAALVRLALIYGALTVLPHAFVLRRRPADLGLGPDGASQVDGSHPLRQGSRDARALHSPSFRWLALAFGLASIATTTVTVHLVPLLMERGFGLGLAGAAMGLLGLMALPGRLLFTPLGARWPRTRVAALIFCLSAAAGITLLLSHSVGAVWAFVVLFGAGFGAITPARAALVAELYGSAHYGRIGGALALVVALGRAVAPVGASGIYLAGGGSGGGYDLVLAGLVLLCLGSAWAVTRAGGEPATGDLQSLRPDRAAAA